MGTSGEVARLTAELNKVTAQRDLLVEAAKIARKYLRGTKEELVEVDLVLGFALMEVSK